MQFLTTAEISSKRLVVDVALQRVRGIVRTASHRRALEKMLWRSLESSCWVPSRCGFCSSLIRKPEHMRARPMVSCTRMCRHRSVTISGGERDDSFGAQRWLPGHNSAPVQVTRFRCAAASRPVLFKRRTSGPAHESIDFQVTPRPFGHRCDQPCSHHGGGLCGDNACDQSHASHHVRGEGPKPKACISVETGATRTF